MNWSALAAAQASDRGARVPWRIGNVRVGSVARVHIDALRAWPQWLRLHDAEVILTAADPTAALATLNGELRSAGLVRGWRDELIAVTPRNGGTPLALIERAAARWWGTLTLGAHANGYVAGPDGRPSHLWIGRRSATKATDPGLLDNLVGGGVPAHQTPWQALLREGWEEAGLDREIMLRATAGSVLRLDRDIPEGLQIEDLHVYDLALPAALLPRNQDGEVQAFLCLPLAEALDLAAGPTMTVDAAMATLDFAVRHHVLPPDAHAGLSRQLFACAVGHAQTT
jgi:8-oxo-dGTP pyrophosphatase MutT (NUDIX family)